MSSSHVRRSLSVGLAATLTVGAAFAAEQSRPTGSSKSSAPTSTRPTTSRSTSARGPLPDPVLLDGSKTTADKKSEYGMIGDFELPGDENARNDKVGGQQAPNGQGGGGALPQAGGGGPQGQPPPQQTAAQGGAGQPDPSQQQGAGGPQNPNAAGNPIAGQGDPNAKPEGTQVAQLGGEPSGEQGAGAGSKPPPVAIGDAAMRIPQSTPTSAGVVGAQVINQNTQVYEKPTGTGGKGPTGQQGPNKTEKGRTIPAGL